VGGGVNFEELLQRGEGVKKNTKKFKLDQKSEVGKKKKKTNKGG